MDSNTITVILYLLTFVIVIWLWLARLCNWHNALDLDSDKFVRYPLRYKRRPAIDVDEHTLVSWRQMGANEDQMILPTMNNRGDEQPLDEIIYL